MLLLSDIRYAARSLTRKPGFALLAIATLGLGIGATTTIFSALYRLVYEQLPFETADRFVNLVRTRDGEGFFLSPTPGVVQAWQERTQLLEQVAMSVTTELTLTGRGDPVALRGARVSPDLAPMLQVEPLIGRTITQDDVAADAKVVVLSEGVWRDRFGGDAAVLGQPIRMSGDAYTVIGVMPDAFSRHSDPFPRQQFWLPYRMTETDHFGTAMAVLREGVTLEAASAELEQIAAGIDVPTPGGRAWDYRAVRVSDLLLTESTRKSLPILLGAVTLVLLIAVANVAGLMIVRINARRREIAIRAALGARHRRIIAGLAVEQALLALGAGVIGLLLAAWSISALPRIAPTGLPLLDTLALDPAVLCFAFVLLVLATLFAGVLPAYSVLRGDLADSLRGGGERVTAGSRARAIMVTLQIATSLILLVGAALLIRSFGSLSSQDPGFDVEGALAIELALPADRYSDDEKRPFFDEVLEGIRAIPGVTDAAVGGSVPPTLGLLFGTLVVDGSSVSTDNISYVSGTSAAPGFLPSLGARFLGRDFVASDGAMNVVVVNRSFVERFWPGENGVGRRIRLASQPDAPWIEIVGVVEDLRANGHAPAGQGDLQVFYPIEWSYPAHSLVVRTGAADPFSVLPAVRQVIARSDAELPLRDVATLEQKLAETLARQRFTMVLLTMFAALALLLSVIGLYGLVAYTVQQRVREIGVRVALGATAATVRSLFVAQGMRLVTIGLAFGILGSVAAVTVLRSLVHGVPLYDGASFASAVAVIAVAALSASWLPARRAAKVDPLTVLRED